jgi:hypothetical protein
MGGFYEKHVGSATLTMWQWKKKKKKKNKKHNIVVGHWVITNIHIDWNNTHARNEQPSHSTLKSKARHIVFRFIIEYSSLRDFGPAPR